ncbi:MAG: DUF3341 domain-containing protein [Candidatus Marinimicrobia bacterium]|nr:DUF3341 domain-containing protein [Candidatus Neomarinimicrobiota bacterium]
MGTKILTVHGILAEFSNPATLIKAAEKVCDAGYQLFDCHSPFLIHGLDAAMGMKRSKLGFVVAVIAGVGAVLGLLLQWWVATVEYPIIVSGKPLFSWQAFLIVTFALMVLFGAFAAVFGMFHFNRLPQLHHPVFYSENFKKASDDGFFISIEAADKIFDRQLTAAFLKEIGGTNVELLEGSE